MASEYADMAVGRIVSQEKGMYRIIHENGEQLGIFPLRRDSEPITLGSTLHSVLDLRIGTTTDPPGSTGTP